MSAPVILEPRPGISCISLFNALKWIDKSPLIGHIEDYRRKIFTAVLDEKDAAGRPRYNMLLAGRSKKNWKSADLCLAALYCLFAGAPGACFLLANDEGQAADDLSLTKKIIEANPALGERLVVKTKLIERTDGRGFLEILPAGDVAGAHGKSYKFCGWDEIHGYRTWDIMEALQPDPTRIDALQWITSYASVFHRAGAPLHDLFERARAGTDPRLLFSWYSGSFTTDVTFADADPETRANPSRGSWEHPGYLAEQRLRLPWHRYQRLHLNEPGVPAGAAFQVEPVMAAIDRGVANRLPEDGRRYAAFTDSSGGSSDDFTLAIAHREPDGTRVLDFIGNQGPPPPFDPRQAVKRFARTLTAYHVGTVHGDAYAGETFREDFRKEGIRYQVSEATTSEHYEALEPMLNAGEVRLLDAPKLEQELLSLVWRGGKITHPGGEHTTTPRRRPARSRFWDGRCSRRAACLGGRRARITSAGPLRRSRCAGRARRRRSGRAASAARRAGCAGAMGAGEMVNATVTVDGRGLDAALRVLKKRLDRDGVTRELKKRQSYLPRASRVGRSRRPRGRANRSGRSGGWIGRSRGSRKADDSRGRSGKLAAEGSAPNNQGGQRWRP